MANRKLDAANEMKAARLKFFVKRAKTEQGLTRDDIAEKSNMSGPAVSQYYNNQIPLNTDVILKFAQILDIHPGEIDPALKDVFMLLQAKEHRITVIGTMSGRLPETNVALLKVKKAKPNLVAIESDQHFLTGEKQRGYIIIDPASSPRKGSTVIYRIRDKFNFYMGDVISYKKGESLVVVDKHGEHEILPQKLSYIARVHEFNTP